jgi:ADP-ribose pyrophosphatase
MSKKLFPIPEVLQSEIRYQSYLTVREDLLKNQSGIIKPYSVALTPSDAAVVLAKTPEGLWILNKEYRHPTGQWLYGCPGGCIDPNESALEAAKRELLEETGYLADEYLLLGSFYPFPGVCSQKVHLVLAKNAKYSQEPRLDPFEYLQVQKMSPSELQEAILQGAPIDGTLAAALFFAMLKGY